MEDIVKIIKSLKDSGLLFRVVNETIQNNVKKKEDFLVCYSVY